MPVSDATPTIDAFLDGPHSRLELLAKQAYSWRPATSTLNRTGIGYLIAAFSPFLAGVIRDRLGDFALAWIGLAALYVLLIAMALRFNPRRYARHHARGGRSARHLDRREAQRAWCFCMK